MLTKYWKSASVLLLLVFLSGCGGAAVGSSYGSMTTAGGLRRTSSHAGVDFFDKHGAPVLAAADGKVVSIISLRGGCGKGVLIAHPLFKKYTVYCHLNSFEVSYNFEVKRGDVIGTVGTTGAVSSGPHVHFELCTTPCSYGHADGDLRETEDPLAITDGCFDPLKQYPTDRLVLTYPVRCHAP